VEQRESGTGQAAGHPLGEKQQDMGQNGKMANGEGLLLRRLINWQRHFSRNLTINS